MSLAAVKPGTATDFTPSEIVLRYCDRFAPPPRFSRVGFEISTAAPFAIAMFIGAAIGLSKLADPTSDLPWWLRLIGWLAAVAMPVFWWRKRRGMDPVVDREDVIVTRLLDGKRVALQEELVGVALSTAVLANEKAGVMALALEGGQLVARFSGVDGQWPASSLEDQLRRERSIAVSELIYDWLADGSHLPYFRAMRMMAYNADRRHLPPGDGDAAGNGDSTGSGENQEVAPVEALLNEVRTQRPAIWKALRASIAKGLKDREVPLRSEEVGNARVPKEWYVEAPIEGLAAQAGSAEAESAARQAGDTEKQSRNVSWPWTLLLVGCALGGTLWGLAAHPNHWPVALINAVVLGVGGTVVGIRSGKKLKRMIAVRESLGLPAVQEGSRMAKYRQMTGNSSVMDKAASGLLFAMLAALPGAYFGEWALLICPAAVGLFWLLQAVGLHEFEVGTAPEVVRARLTRMAKAEEAHGERAEVEAKVVPEGAGAPATRADGGFRPRIPDRPTPAYELPTPPPAVLESVTCWTARWAAFKRLGWRSFIVLSVGYIALVLLFWNSPGKERWVDPKEDGLWRDVPAVVFLLVAGTAMYLIWSFTRDHRERSAIVGKNRQNEEGRWSTAPLTAIWRVAILAMAPYLFLFATRDARAHAVLFAAAAILFVAAHWGWTEWEIRRVLRRIPVPVPRRLMLLRVFGSPAFDDLVELIQPWRRVGCIEHLEGFDTVGRSAEVVAALEAGDIDRGLVKSLPEIEAQFSVALNKPDSDLLYGRHAFQCTNTIWQEAVKRMLARADVVLMDLSSLSVERQGCAWELGQLLDHVPLEKVTLLVNDNTDMDCLRGILESAADRMPEDSPNRREGVAWQLISIGGLSARQPEQSYYDWKRRLDQRLDSEQLAAWLLSTAGPRRLDVVEGARKPLGIDQCGQARLVWLVLVVISALLTVQMWARR